MGRDFPIASGGVGAVLIKVSKVVMVMICFFSIVGGSFVSERPCQKPWIQVDLEQFIEVHAVMVTRQNSKFVNHTIYAAIENVKF